MNGAEAIGLAVGVVVAASLALQAALGPAVTTIVEAIKATGILPPGWAGVAALATGTVLGLLTGALAWQRTGDGVWLLVGAFAGLVLGAGGVQSYQARIGAVVVAGECPPVGAGASDTATGASVAERPPGDAAIATPPPPIAAATHDAGITPWSSGPISTEPADTCVQRTTASPGHG